MAEVTAQTVKDTMEQTGVTLKVIKEFFGMSLTEMKDEWVKGGLTDNDKMQIVTGLADKSLTYA